MSNGSKTPGSESEMAPLNVDLDTVVGERPKPQLSKEELVEAGVRAGFTKPSEMPPGAEAAKEKAKRGAAKGTVKRSEAVSTAGERPWRRSGRTTALNTNIKPKHHERLMELVQILSEKEDRPISKAEVLERGVDLLHAQENK